MSVEQAAIASLAAVTSALCFMFNLLRLRSEACELWRTEKEPIITAMAQKLGIAQATSDIVNACKVTGCPFAGNLESTFSVTEKTKNTKK